LRGSQDKLDVLVDVLSGRAPISSIPSAVQLPTSALRSRPVDDDVDEEDEEDTMEGEFVEEEDALVTEPDKLGVDDESAMAEEDDGYTSDVSRDELELEEEEQPTRSGKSVAPSVGSLNTEVKEPTLIFCNTVPSCRAVEHRLTELGFKTTSYHGLVPSKVRAANFKRFTSGEVPILVCTDIAARGLDTTFVKHVILFDFPLNPIDYLHRVGRTARAGQAGRATSLVAKRDRVLAEAIRRARAAGTAIHLLSSDKKFYTAANSKPSASPVSMRPRKDVPHEEALFKPRKPPAKVKPDVAPRKQHARSFASYAFRAPVDFDPWESGDPSGPEDTVSVRPFTQPPAALAAPRSQRSPLLSSHPLVPPPPTSSTNVSRVQTPSTPSFFFSSSSPSPAPRSDLHHLLPRSTSAHLSLKFLDLS